MEWKIYVFSSHFLLGLGHKEQTTGGRQRKHQLSLCTLFLSFKLRWCKERKIYPIPSSDWQIYECVLLFTVPLDSFQISLNKKKFLSKIRTQRKSVNMKKNMYISIYTYFKTKVNTLFHGETLEASTSKLFFKIRIHDY